MAKQSWGFLSMKSSMIRTGRKDWFSFICTDMDLSENEILRTYLYRWKTECNFKICKSYLKLRTKCHSTSYDAITAHMAVAALLYMALAMEEFNNEDTCSIAEIMHGIRREVMCEVMFQTFTQLPDILFTCIKEYFQATEKLMDALIDRFIEKLLIKIEAVGSDGKGRYWLIYWRKTS